MITLPGARCSVIKMAFTFCAGSIAGDVEQYIFNNTDILKMLVSNALVQCAPLLHRGLCTELSQYEGL